MRKAFSSQHGFAFDNTYARELEGFYVPVEAAQVAKPRLLQWNRTLADELGLDSEALGSEQGAAIFAGNQLPEGASPLAQAYAGHQFGGFVPQLGDGRALLLGEMLDGQNRRRDLQLKGSGRTPFSRGGDGKAPLGAVLREHLIGEAMHALGIPTTRALASVATGESVFRETPVPGAVLTRVAASHIRVGTFQFFAARGERDKVQRLADYSIVRHHPQAADAENRYLALLAAVADVQASLVAGWMHVGFVHGVMNTDNMTISGETIDYGPCAFIDAYHPQAVFSSIDRNGRYAYANQPVIAQWNLARLAETLLPLIHEDETRAIELATEVVDGFAAHFGDVWLDGMRAKLGLTTAEEGDLELANDFLAELAAQRVDFTSAWRALAASLLEGEEVLSRRFEDASGCQTWIARWQERLAREPMTERTRVAAMNRVNPLYIPRNHKVEEALAAAVESQDLEPFETLLTVLARPFEEQPGHAGYAVPAPESFGSYKTFCGT